MNVYHTPERIYAWMLNVSVDDQFFQFGSDRQVTDLDDMKEVVSCVIGTYNGHTMNLLSEIKGKFNGSTFVGNALIADDLVGSDYDIDLDTSRDAEIRVTQTKLREKTIFA